MLTSVHLEAWRTVPGYEDLYEVSSLGRVRSLRRKGGRNRWYGGKILQAVPGYFGYLSLNLCGGRRQRTYRVHELVALAFHGPRPEWAQCIRHLDGNPAYNTPWNCVYGTDSENANDTIRHGNHYFTNRSKTRGSASN